MNNERIPLRAFWLEGPGHPGIALPDGRFIVAEGERAIGSYSSERMMLKEHPGARLFWSPDADETINKVSEEDELR